MPFPRHIKSRGALTDTVFWDILSNQQEKTEARWDKAADLYTAAYNSSKKHHGCATDSLRTELGLLQCDLHQYRFTFESMRLADIAGLYTAAGIGADDAWRIAKNDFRYIEKNLQTVENWVRAIRAEIRF